MALQPVVKRKMSTRSSSSNLLSGSDSRGSVHRESVLSKPFVNVKNYKLNIETALEKNLQDVYLITFRTK